MKLFILQIVESMRAVNRSELFVNLRLTFLETVCVELHQSLLMAHLSVRHLVVLVH